MNRPPFETFKRATCKGCYALGTACGNCERCGWERAQMKNATALRPDNTGAFARKVEELAQDFGIELHDFADGPPKGDEWLSISFREKPQEQRNL